MRHSPGLPWRATFALLAALAVGCGGESVLQGGVDARVAAVDSASDQHTSSALDPGEALVRDVPLPDPGSDEAAGQQDGEPGGSADPAGSAGAKDTTPTSDEGASDDGAADEGGADEDVGQPEPDGATTPSVRRIVVAGDSWSAGMVFPEGGPLRAALDARGFEELVITWEQTALAGSKVSQWAHNEHGMLNLLFAALDEEPPAEVLFMVIAGNDLLRASADGLGDWWRWRQEATFDAIEQDVEQLVDAVLAGRPHLQVVLVGYDYLHFEMIHNLISKMKGMDTAEFNENFVELGRRKLSVAQRTPRCHYAHNFGILQYRLGDTLHPPFLNPPAPYEPGVVPFPGRAPGYQPFPGGIPLFPGPLGALPDGVHPTGEAHRLIIDNVLDQGLESLLLGQGW